MFTKIKNFFANLSVRFSNEVTKLKAKFHRKVESKPEVPTVTVTPVAPVSSTIA